jgi:putative FmdB family regulatory protein
MPTYPHICRNCNHEWEDTYSIKQDPPTLCPNCNVDGYVKRQISIPGNVTVELTGRELVTKLWKEGKELAKQARKDEKLAHDLYGK